MRTSTLAAIIAAVTTITVANGAAVETVNLGVLPPLPTQLVLYNGVDETGIPSAGGYYVGGPVNSGVLTGNAGTPSFIYEFSSDQPFNIYGADGGPLANFANVAIYSGTPSNIEGLVVSGQFFCGCGPGEGGFSLTTINESYVFNGAPRFDFTVTPGSLDLSPGSYFVELSDPTLTNWQNGPNGFGLPSEGTFLDVVAVPNTVPVPLPGSMELFGSGLPVLVALHAARRRKQCRMMA